LPTNSFEDRRKKEKYEETCRKKKKKEREIDENRVDREIEIELKRALRKINSLGYIFKKF
jgi:hypothetical protein